MVARCAGAWCRITVNQCRQILGDNYFRLAPVFPPDVVIPFDGVKRIPELLEFGETVDISQAVKWLKAAW